MGRLKKGLEKLKKGKRKDLDKNAIKKKKASAKKQKKAAIAAGRKKKNLYGKYVTDVHRPQDAFTLPVQVKGKKITYGYDKKQKFEKPKEDEKKDGKGKKRAGGYKCPTKGALFKDSLYFQIGRICQVNYGPDVNKICVILDFVDSNKCLVTGPREITGVRRQVISFKRLSMTPMKIKISVGQGETYITKCFKEAGIWEKWKKHPWYLKRQQQLKRRNLTDFDRFKVMLLRQRKSQLIFRETLKLKEILRVTNNGKGLTRSAKQLYWTAKRAGENPKHWNKKLRPNKKEDPKKKKKKRINEPTKKRARSRKRSKKISVEKLAAKKSHSRKLRKLRSITRRKLESAEKNKAKPAHKPTRRANHDVRKLKKKFTCLELRNRKLRGKREKESGMEKIAKKKKDKAAALKTAKEARRAAGEKVSLRKAKMVAE